MVKILVGLILFSGEGIIFSNDFTTQSCSELFALQCKLFVTDLKIKCHNQMGSSMGPEKNKCWKLQKLKRSDDQEVYLSYKKYGCFTSI